MSTLDLIRSSDRLYVGGEWIGAPATAPVIDPSTGQEIGTAPLGDRQLAEMAIAAAREAFDRGPWRKLPQRERTAVILRFIDRIEQRSEEIVATMIYNGGNIVRDARPLLYGMPMDIIRYMVPLADTLVPEGTPPTVTPLPTGGSLLGIALKVREPIGVIAAISAYNGPFFMNVAKALPAMVVGNSVVVKPSEYTPLDALILAQIADEIGIPPGVFNVVTGGAEVGETLTGDPRVDMVSFTGSDAVGARIMAQAAPTLKKLQLELGGKSAMIVRADANLDVVVPNAAFGTFTFNCGQGCALLTRHLVHNSLRADYVQRLSEMVGQIRIGAADDPETQMGPMIREVALDRMERFVQNGLSDGATLVRGGNRSTGTQGGFYFEPTIFDNVDNMSRIAQEEAFGPLACVIGFDTDEEAIELANQSDYGLGGGIWSADTGRAYEMALAVRTGTIAINGGTGRYGPSAPFGGVKRSGIGREWGLEGLLEYTSLKSVSFHAG